MGTRVLRVFSFTLVLLLGLGVALFIASETITDPGGWQAVGLIAIWGVPLLVLSLLAVTWPDLATEALVPLLVLVATFAVADAAIDLIDHDTWGPAGTIAVFTVGIPCGLLGWRHAARAGWMLIGASAIQFVAVLTQLARNEGEPIRSALGGSSGALVLPFLVLGVLFLLTAVSEGLHLGHHRHQPPMLGAAH